MLARARLRMHVHHLAVAIRAPLQPVSVLPHPHNAGGELPHVVQGAACRQVAGAVTSHLSIGQLIGDGWDVCILLWIKRVVADLCMRKASAEAAAAGERSGAARRGGSKWQQPRRRQAEGSSSSGGGRGRQWLWQQAAAEGSSGSSSSSSTHSTVSTFEHSSQPAPPSLAPPTRQIASLTSPAIASTHHRRYEAVLGASTGTTCAEGGGGGGGGGRGGHQRRQDITAGSTAVLVARTGTTCAICWGGGMSGADAQPESQHQRCQSIPGSSSGRPHTMPPSPLPHLQLAPRALLPSKLVAWADRIPPCLQRRRHALRQQLASQRAGQHRLLQQEAVVHGGHCGKIGGGAGGGGARERRPGLDRARRWSRNRCLQGGHALVIADKPAPACQLGVPGTNQSAASPMQHCDGHAAGGGM